MTHCRAFTNFDKKSTLTNGVRDGFFLFYRLPLRSKISNRQYRDSKNFREFFLMDLDVRAITSPWSSNMTPHPDFKASGRPVYLETG